MKSALLRRLKRLEEVRTVENWASVEFQMGYLKRLPEEFAGERHVVTVGLAADGTYRWEDDVVRRQPVKTAPRRSSDCSWCGRRMDDRTIRGPKDAQP